MKQLLRMNYMYIDMTVPEKGKVKECNESNTADCTIFEAGIKSHIKQNCWTENNVFALRGDCFYRGKMWIVEVEGTTILIKHFKAKSTISRAKEEKYYNIHFIVLLVFLVQQKSTAY